MLIYANSLTLNPAGGRDTLIELIAKWMGFRAKTYINPQELAKGIGSFRLKDHSTVTSSATLDHAGKPLFPYYFCATLSHQDQQVSGRRWTTEVGLFQASPVDPYIASVLLKTDEVSARVTTPIKPTRPKLVEMLVDSGRPTGQTAGIKVKILNLKSAPAYLIDCQRPDRRYPIILISSPFEGPDIIDADRLRSMLVGLADVVIIEPGANTFALSDAIGKSFMAYGGAINIIFPPRSGKHQTPIENTLLTLPYLQAMKVPDTPLETELFSIITHRTNVTNAWRHTSPTTVAQAVLQNRMTALLERSKLSDQSEEIQEYIELLEIADKDIRIRDGSLSALQNEYQERCDYIRVLENDIESLKHALKDKRPEQLSPSLDMTSQRDSINTILGGNPTLQQVLEVVATLYPDRLVVLQSAIDSARESDRGGFRHGRRAYDLLIRFTEAYWQVLASGKGDQDAKSCFGYQSYSSNEGEGVTLEGRRRRTFTYKGNPYCMIKHLKHGHKDSLADTLRIHFEWIPDEKRLVIGHCGKHLDF